MKIEYQDKIENYLLNRMSDKERLAFEQDLEKDAELRNQYEFVSMVKTALMLENIDKDVCEWSKAYKERKEQEVKEREEQNWAANYRPTGTDCNYCPVSRMEQKPILSHFFSRKILYWVSGIAAMFIVGIFIFNNLPSLLPGFDGESASQLNYSSNKNSDVSFKGSHQMDIESLLAQGDYSKALTQIEEYEANIRTELMLIERAVSSRGERNRVMSSREEGEREMSSRGESPYSIIEEQKKNKLNHLLYLKAQALIGLNRKEEAVILLDEICHSDSTFKEQADSLYNILKE